MQTQAQLQRNTISLKGSSQIVTEFFQYAVQWWVVAVASWIAPASSWPCHRCLVCSVHRGAAARFEHRKPHGLGPPPRALRTQRRIVIIRGGRLSTSRVPAPLGRPCPAVPRRCRRRRCVGPTPQHPVPAGGLPLGDLRAEEAVRPGPVGQHRRRAHQVPEDGAGADEGWVWGEAGRGMAWRGRLCGAAAQSATARGIDARRLRCIIVWLLR